MKVCPSQQTIRTTVLLCTAGRPHLLDRAISSLASAYERPDQLVVVNGGDDAANRVVARHAQEFREVVLLQYSNRNLSTSRNLGLPECTGDIVAMTDDDAVVAADWITQMKRAHAADAGAGAIGGAVYGPKGGAFLSRVADRVVFPSFRERRVVRTLPGVNISYKRRVVDEVGGFDEALFRGEDVDFNWRVIQHSYHIVYEPEIHVTHQHRSTLAGFLQQQYMYGRAYVLVRRKWQDMYCVYPHTLRTARDWAKLFHCMAATLYRPAVTSARMPTLADKIRAFPVLVVHDLAWKTGMLRQALALTRREPISQEVLPLPQTGVVSLQVWSAGKEVTRGEDYVARTLTSSRNIWQ
jgi:GT2 family glycosyltransferase